MAGGLNPCFTRQLFEQLRLARYLQFILHPTGMSELDVPAAGRTDDIHQAFGPKSRMSAIRDRAFEGHLGECREGRLRLSIAVPTRRLRPDGIGSVGASREVVARV